MPFVPYIDPATRPGDLSPNAFGAVGGGVQTQTVLSDYDIYKPNELTYYFDRHAYKPGFRVMLKTMGFRRGTAAPTTGHYEAPWREDLVEVGTIVTASTGPGTPVTVALAATSMFDASVTVNGASVRASYPRERDILVFTDGNRGIITAKNTTTTPHQITIKPLDTTVNLATSIVAGGSYFIGTNAHAEGSGLPTGRISRVIKYTNTFQIVKEYCQVTGSSLTNEVYMQPVEGQSGSWWLRTSMETLSRFEKQCDGALLWGQQINNHTEFVAELGHDVAVTGTEGFIEFGTANGYRDNYTPGAYAMQDFDDIAKLYEAERTAVRKLMSLQGFSIYQEVENVLQAFLNADVTAQLTRDYFRHGVEMDEEQPVSEIDMALSIGFYGLRKSGYEFNWKLMHCFNEYIGAGAPGYDYTNWQILYPLGYMSDKGTGDYRATIGYEYKQLAGDSREEVIAHLAGVGTAGTGTSHAIATNPNDIKGTGLLAEIAFHGTCPNHIVIQRPV